MDENDPYDPDQFRRDDFVQDDDDLDQAITAANLLDTTVCLCVNACQLAAQTGSTDEWEQHADYVALCIARPAQTRALARDFMAVVANNARRRLGADLDLTGDQFITALRLVGSFEERVLSRLPAAAA